MTTVSDIRGSVAGRGQKEIVIASFARKDEHDKLDFKSMFRRAIFIITGMVLAFWAGPVTAKAEAFPVSIRVHADQPVGEWKPIWRFFGADEPNYATLPDGRKLMAELGRLRMNEVFFRTHNLLTSGDGTPALKWGSTGVYDEDP